jgi:hypothetical protein
MTGSRARPGQRPAPAPRRLSAPVRQVVLRFAEVVCPRGAAPRRQMEQVLDEFELTLGALPPAARAALVAAFLALDRGARLYPPSRGRRFTRLDDLVADAYLRALMARRHAVADVVTRLKSLVVMCYYELHDVQLAIGYDPAPYIAAVARRRLESYRAQIEAGEAAVTDPADAGWRPSARRAGSGQQGAP